FRRRAWLLSISSRRRHTISLRDWSSDVCSSDLGALAPTRRGARQLLLRFTQSSPTARTRLTSRVIQVARRPTSIATSCTRTVRSFSIRKAFSSSKYPIHEIGLKAPCKGRLFLCAGCFGHRGHRAVEAVVIAERIAVDLLEVAEVFVGHDEVDAVEECRVPIQRAQIVGDQDEE